MQQRMNIARQAEEMARMATITRIQDQADIPCKGNAYSVSLDGKLYGTVYASTRESCRYAGRLRYAVKQVKCWRAQSAHGKSTGLGRDIRREAICDLFEDSLRSMNLEAP